MVALRLLLVFLDVKLAVRRKLTDNLPPILNDPIVILVFLKLRLVKDLRRVAGRGGFMLQYPASRSSKYDASSQPRNIYSH